MNKNINCLAIDIILSQMQKDWSVFIYYHIFSKRLNFNTHICDRIELVLIRKYNL